MSTGRLKVSDELVSRLLTSQHPDLASIELGRHYAREDHTTVRVGDAWGVRLPTVPGLDSYYARSRGLLAGHRHRWTFPSSTPLRDGLPDDEYPYHWEVTGWITASNAALVPLTASAGPVLGEALRQIHVPATDAVPDNPRTMPGLVTYSDGFQRLLDTVQAAAPLGASLHTSAIDAAWKNALHTRVGETATWTHGRLEPQSVLSDRGDMAGLLMWEFFGAGDPAADLGMASALLPAEGIAAMYDAYGTSTTELKNRAVGYQIRELLRHATSTDHNVVHTAWHGLVNHGYALYA